MSCIYCAPKFRKRHTIGPSLHVYKCFDQIMLTSDPWPLIYVLADTVRQFQSINHIPLCILTNIRPRQLGDHEMGTAKKGSPVSGLIHQVGRNIAEVASLQVNASLFNCPHFQHCYYILACTRQNASMKYYTNNCNDFAFYRYEVQSVVSHTTLHHQAEYKLN